MTLKESLNNSKIIDLKDLGLSIIEILRSFDNMNKNTNLNVYNIPATLMNLPFNQEIMTIITLCLDIEMSSNTGHELKDITLIT